MENVSLSSLGDLDKTYTLPDNIIAEAKKVVLEQDGYIAASRVKLKCGKSDQEPIDYASDRFSIDTDTSPVHIGNWQIKVEGRAYWNCGKAVWSDGKCKCVCVVNMYTHITLSKVYTFRPIGYNPDNSKTSIQVLNYIALYGQVLGGGGFNNLGLYGNPGPSYNSKQSFILNYSKKLTRTCK